MEQSTVSNILLQGELSRPTLPWVHGIPKQECTNCEELHDADEMTEGDTLENITMGRMLGFIIAILELLAFRRGT